MKKLMVEELKQLSEKIDMWEWRGYQPTDKERVRLHYLRTLRKVIKLKNHNRDLCRKLKKVKSFGCKAHISSPAISYYDTEIDKIISLSKKIGENNQKLRKLRTEHSQMKAYYTRESLT